MTMTETQPVMSPDASRMGASEVERGDVEAVAERVRGAARATFGGMQQAYHPADFIPTTQLPVLP